MKIKTYHPKNSTLKKYINFFYEYTLNDDNYLAFPSPCNVVSFFKNGTMNYKNHQLFIKEGLTSEKCIYSLNKFTKPLKVITSGKIKEFVIIFKPHGLKQFVDFNSHGIQFHKIDEFNDFLEKNTSFFSHSMKNKTNIIEEYLLSKLNEKKGFDVIDKSIDLIKNTDLTTIEIAKINNYKYKTFYRLFLSHCGTTPRVIRKNIRLRAALEKIKNKDVNSKLSDIALDLGYYDQAVFNKEFKNLTAETPLSFFKKTSVLSKDNIYFKNLKRD